MIQPEQLVESEWAEWYRLTPIQRWLESEKLWQNYLALGGSLDPEPDTQSPFFDARTPRPRLTHGRSGVRVLREAQSGATENRKQLRKLLGDCERGIVGTIIIPSIDRLSRDVRIAENLFHIRRFHHPFAMLCLFEDFMNSSNIEMHINIFLRCLPELGILIG